MKSRTPWYIWGQDGEHLTRLKEASVRQGRSLRAAKRIKQYSKAQIFISKAETKEDVRSQERRYARVYA